jgi:hypothetical protein
MIFDVPRITEATRDGLTSEESSVIYNTTTSRYEYYDGTNWGPFTFGLESGEPTGFPINSAGEVDRTTSTISFDNGTRTFSIAPASTSFIFMIKGKLFKKTSAQTQTITDTEGLWFFYFDDNGDLQKTQTFSNDFILKYCYVAYLYWDAESNIAIHFGDERHGLAMDAHSHIWKHATHGAAYISGLGLSNFNFNAGALAIDVQFSVGSGYIRDEDILHTISPVSSTTGLRVLYRTGAGSSWRRGFQSGYSALSYSSGSRIAYNQYTNGAWQLTEVTNNKFVCYHIVATNDVNYGVMAIMGENEYGSKAEARAGANSEINNLSGLPFYEFRFIGTVLYQTSDSYSNDLKAKIVTTDTGADYVDWRFTALQPTTATTNVHNNLGGIDNAPYYHGDQPIRTVDNVVFNSVTNTTKSVIGTYEIFPNDYGMSFNQDIDLGNSTNTDYVFSSGANTKDTFIVLFKKDVSNGVGMGLKATTDKDEFLFAGRNADTDFIFLKNMGSTFTTSGGTQVAKIDKDGVLTIGSISSTNFSITSGGAATFTSLIVNGDSTLNADTILMKDPIIRINNSAPSSAPTKDIGVEFKYYDTNGTALKTGFFGYIMTSDVADDGIDYFAFLHNTTNTSEKITGTLSTIKSGALFANSLNSNSSTFSIDSSGNIIGNAITLNTSYGITSSGVGTLSSLTVNNNLTVTGDLTVNGDTVTLNTSTLSVEDPVIKINRGTLSSMYTSSDLGIEFNYYDTAARIGFFGMELETDGTLKYFKLLKLATNTSEKFTGTDADLKAGTVYPTSLVINTSYGINSSGRGLFDQITVSGTDTLLDTTNVKIKDPVPVLNNQTLSTMYTSTDLGFIFNYYDTTAKQAFFGLEVNASTGAIVGFEVLSNITNTSKKITGTAANLTVGNITSNAITVNTSYGITSSGDGTLNSLTVNSRKYRNGESSVLTSGTIDLSASSHAIYKFDQTTNSVATINLTNGLVGEVIYMRIRSNGSSYSWGSNIKWPAGIAPVPSANGKTDIYSFVCYTSTIYFGTFAFDYTE